jgi:5-methylcytosine-specific restriction endonuclease McrA
MERGLMVPAEIVHHKVHLTPENINDPSVSLAWENLEALCRECHAEEHTGHPKRFKVDENGRIIPRW